MALLTNTVFAQQVTITGVVSGNDSIRIEYATVALYRLTDSTYTVGVITDSVGHFTLKAPSGEYSMEINHLGYERFTSKIALFSSAFHVGTLCLTPTAMSIDEVVVVGKIPAVRLTAEKSVYNVSDMSASQSGSIKDVLRTVPSLTVDFNENVMLGGAPVRFLVDGQEISSSELAAYSPSQIASIEVIANPTSKYDASGLSGIVQLVTKKNRTSGVSGTVNLSGAHDTQIVSAGVSYNHKKLSVSTNFSLWKNYQHGSIETRTDANEPFFNEANADVTDITANLKIGYNLNPDNALFVSYQYLNFGYLANDSSPKRIGKTDMKGITYQFATGYSRKISPKGESLKTNFYYNNTSPTTYSVLDYTDRKINISNNNRNHSFIGTLDYLLPFTENIKFEVGIKSHTRDIAIDRSDNFSGTLQNDKFEMRESILAGYLLVNSHMGKFNLQAGIRGESNLVRMANRTRKLYVFPNLSVAYATSEKSLFSLGYNKRINRPTAADLNPFLLLVDPTNRFQGNPNLMPEYSHNFFADYTGNFQSHKLKVAAYYRRISNLITKTYETVADDILYTPVNIPFANFYGIDITSTHNVGKRVMLQPSAGMLVTNIPSEVSKHLKQNTSYYIGLTVSLKLPSDFNIQALANYTSRSLSVGSSYQSAMVQGLALGKSQLWSEVSISKSILKERLNLSLRMTDPFSLMQKGYDTYGRNSSQQTIYHFDTRFVYFGISYRFNNHKSSKQNYDDGGIKVF